MGLVLSSDGVPLLSSDGTALVTADSIVSVPNKSYLTATALALGASFNQNVESSRVTDTIWYSFTPLHSGVITFFAFGNLTYYIAHTQVLVAVAGLSGIPAPYLAIVGSSVPLRVPVTVGNVYYFAVSTTGTPDTLTISLMQAPDAVNSGLSILIADPDPGFEAELVSLTTGSELGFIPFPAGQDIDVLISGGNILAEDTLASTITQLRLLDPSLTNLLTITRANLGWPTNGERIRIRSNLFDTFYVATEGRGTNAIQAASINNNGAIGATHWIVEGHGLSGIAVSPDQQTMYYSHGGIAPVKKWNLATNTAGSDLVAAVASYNTDNMLVFPDGTILVMYSNLSQAFARLYATDGSTIRTFTIGTTSGLGNLVVYTHDYTSFLAVTTSTVSSVDYRTLTVIMLSTGGVISTTLIAKYNKGALSSPPTVG